MTQPDIHQFPCLKDNYGVLVHDREGGSTISIDAPDAAAVTAALDRQGWQLTHILVTHHHADHTAGIAALKKATACTVYAPRAEMARIPPADIAIGEPDILSIGSLKIAVLDTPGHTIGHVSYWMADAGVAFVGDTLFAMGCGRVLEGTPGMMWTSLQKIAGLPLATSLYCGHEYTVSNGRFGLSIEPDNTRLQERLADAERTVAEGRATLPTRLEDEIDTNVFLRAGLPAVRDRIGLAGAPDWKVFAELRERKNKF